MTFFDEDLSIQFFHTCQNGFRLDHLLLMWYNYQMAVMLCIMWLLRAHQTPLVIVMYKRPVGVALFKQKLYQEKRYQQTAEGASHFPTPPCSDTALSLMSKKPRVLAGTQQ